MQASTNFSLIAAIVILRQVTTDALASLKILTYYMKSFFPSQMSCRNIYLAFIMEKKISFLPQLVYLLDKNITNLFWKASILLGWKVT